jgi:preprotein translocase subunit SecD
VYLVLRDGPEEKDVRPLRDGEALAVDRHRYAKPDDKRPPRFLVVRAAPDVELDLAGPPEAVKEGEEVVRILLKLRPKAAAALERLTSDRVGKRVAVVVGGEVVTTHKVRQAVRGGEVQITSCAPGGAEYLLERLKPRDKDR